MVVLGSFSSWEAQRPWGGQGPGHTAGKQICVTGNLSLFALPLFLILWKEGPPQTCSPYSSRHRGICRKLLDLIESWGALFCPMFPCELLKVTMQQDPHVLSSSAFSHLCSSSTLKPNLCTELLNLLGQLEMCKKTYSLRVCLSCPRILPQSTWLSWVWKLLWRKVRKAHRECLLLSRQV